MMLRGRAPKVTGPSCCTCWMFSLLMCITVPLKTAAPQNTHNCTDNQGVWFYSSSGPADGSVYLWFISDAVFFGLMVQSSGSMVLLHRHRQRVQYVHTPHWAPQMPPRDQSRPQHPDAGGHLCHRLHTEFHFFFLSRFLLKYSSMVDTDHSYFDFMFPHF